MIEAHNLTRRYGDFTAVDQISFAVNEGEIVGILGPNGAGKTTTIRMVTGFLPPSGGRISVADRDLETSASEARRQIGYLPESVAIYPEMRVSEYLAYRALLEGMHRGEAKKAIEETIEGCLLEEVRHQIVGTISRGFRQRVGLAAAILHRPRVLVLDEPTLGLDPKQIVAIRQLIKDLGRERTVLLSTHILPEVELLCDRVVIIDRGKIVAEGTPDGLRESWQGSNLLRVGLKGRVPEAGEILEKIEGVLSVSRSPEDDGRFELECETSSDPRESVFGAAVENGWVLLELAEQRASLEDVFVRLTTREEARVPAGDSKGEDGAGVDSGEAV